MRGHFFFTCTIIFILVFGSCESSKLEVFSIDFSNQKIDTCNKAVDTETFLFFKLKNKETLILKIPEKILKNEESATPTELKIPDQAQLYYRLFEENVTNDYFCKELPSAESKLIKNIKASKGLVSIGTKKLEDEQKKISFKHTFTLSKVLLTNEDGQEVFSEKLVYGTFVTIPPTPKSE